VKEFLEVLLSNIVRDVSQQDPEDLRIRRRQPQLTDAPVFDLFCAHLGEQRTRLSTFAARANKAPCRFGKARVYETDSRETASLRRAGVRAGTVDAVVTSPPYATALPYIDTDRLSILLLDSRVSSERSKIEESLTGSREIRNGIRRELETSIEHGNFAEIPSVSAQRLVSTIYRLNKNADVGFRRRNVAALLYRYFADMAKVFSNLESALKPGGSAFFVIGDNVTVAGGKELAIKSTSVIAEIAENLGWQIRQRIPITVTTDKRPHTRNSITDNDIVWCEKPK
jgi:hypothetical protein